MTKTRAVFAAYFGILFFAAFVFVGSWRLDYWQGRLYVLLALVGVTLNQLIQRKGSDLVLERARGARAGEGWDKKLLGIYSLLTVITFVTAGLDSGRFGWSGPVPVGVTIGGVLLMLAGQVIFALAMRENEFFSSTARIQTDRGHRVCESGLYRIIRHPGYFGMMLSLLAFPLVLGSYWSFIPVSLGTATLVVRTVLEDGMLLRGLQGYGDYARRTRWRLIPGLF
jgi:protein-S-isoprenylcysteine O-methyltransferase Ste14